MNLKIDKITVLFTNNEFLLFSNNLFFADLKKHENIISDNGKLGHVKISTNAPKMDGIANAGTIDGNVSAEDHVHPSDTSKVSLNLLGSSTYTLSVSGTVGLPLKTISTNADLTSDYYGADYLVFINSSSTSIPNGLCARVSKRYNYSWVIEMIYASSTTATHHPTLILENGVPTVYRLNSEHLLSVRVTQIGLDGVSAGGALSPFVKLANAWTTSNLIVESGTFTPTLAGSMTAGVQTYIRQIGHYRRIGNIITIFFRLELSKKDITMAGEVRITGLPFVSVNSTLLENVSSCLWNYISLSVNMTKISAINVIGTNAVRLYQSGNNAMWSALAPTNLNDNSGITGTLTYMIS